jgi:outer membrane receptor protein involved in Fe transport
MAGIINIALKSQVDLGYSGGGTAQMANSNRYNGGGNLGYQVGKVTSFVNLGINNDYRDTYGVNDLSRVRTNGFTDQDINTLTGNKGQNLNANLDYKLNARDVWSNQLSLNHRTSIDQTSSAIDEKLTSTGSVASYDRIRDTKASGNFVDYDMAFKRIFEQRKHEWSAEARVNRSQDDDHTNLLRNDAGAAGYVEGERDYTNSLSKSLTLQSDYMKMTGARTKIETGWKTTARWLDRDFDVQKDALGNGNWQTDPTANALSFDETVHAVYGVLSQGVGKFDLQAGLRGEEANRDFQLKSSAQDYPYRYGSVFPSGVVSYNFSDVLNTKLSYSRRIRRPGTQELNPFATFFDPQNVFFGNPNLNPEYTDAIEGGINKQYKYGSMQFSPFYRHTTNSIQPTIKTGDTYQGRDVTSITFGNFATSNSYGTDVNGTFRLGQKLNALGGFNLFKVVTDGSTLSAVSTNTVTWQARTNVSSWVTPTFMVQVNYQYRAPMKISGGEFQQVQNINFAFRKKIDGDNSSIMLRVLDPFSTNKFKVKAGDDNIIQLTERTAGVRGVFLVYQYSFGQVPRIRQVEAPSQQGGTPFP